MKLNLVKDEMSILIENMTEQFEMIHQHETEIPQIELDIFMRNIQKLYENTLFLNKLNKPEKAVNKNEMNHSQIEKIEEIQIEKIEEIQTETADIIEETTTETESIIEEKVETTVAEKLEINIEEQAEASIELNDEKPMPDLTSFTSDIKLNQPKEEDKEEFVKEQKEVQAYMENPEPEEKEILKVDSKKETEASLSFDDILERESDQQEVDLFSSVKANSEIVDLNNKLAEARNTQSIVEKLQSKRIENLKAVIGVNDKFYFINELFAGNSQKYEDIIYTLNNFKKLEDAMVYFSTLKYKFSWDEESDAYKKLVLMLERKFDMTHA